jgi:hypothetical protein
LQTKPDVTEQTGRDGETPESRAKAFDHAGLEAELLGTVETLREMPLDLPQLLGREGPVHVIVEAPERVPAGKVGD